MTDNRSQSESVVRSKDYLRAKDHIKNEIDQYLLKESNLVEDLTIREVRKLIDELTSAAYYAAFRDIKVIG